MTAHITCPTFDAQVHVQVPGAGTAGTISASGTAFDDDKARGAPFVKIYGLVFQGLKDVNSPDVPLNHPAWLAGLNPLPNGLHWFLPQVEGAICQAGTGPGLPRCTLVVWASFQNVALDLRDFKPFFGRCDGGQVCQPPSSGSGDMFAGGGSSGQVAYAVDLVPAAWRVEVAGLPRGKGAFHGRWVLHLRRPVATHCVWDNGGDGVAAPQVRLRCEAPLASEWRLSLHHAKAGAAEYTRPAAEWNPLAANVLHLAPPNGNGSDGFPATLTVVPA